VAAAAASKSRAARAKKKTAKRKSASVVPVLKTPPEPSAYFPFPSSAEDTATPQQEDFQQQRDRLPEMQQQENGKMLQRMHMARARYSGRAQSGGVKGVLTAEDGGENF
jgi:cysteine protease ATG4